MRVSCAWWLVGAVVVALGGSCDLADRPPVVVDLPDSISGDLFPHLPPVRRRAIPAPVTP